VTAPISVVIGEPDYLAREGLVRALEAAEGIAVVSICSNLRALRAAAALEKPDVILMALRFSPRRTSEAIDLVEDLWRACDELGIVLVGDRSDFTLALPLFERSAPRLGFVLRDRIANARELTRMVREIARGNSLVDPAAVGTLISAARQRSNGRFDLLTEREREVLAMVARADSNKAIARELGITTRAVERHVNSIFRKLELDGNGEVNRRVKVALEYASTGDPAAGAGANRRSTRGRPTRSSR
jgi:DNA-binding NarL/FixJ family response regulator